MNFLNNLFKNLSTIQRNLLMAIIAILIYGSSSAISYSLFSSVGGLVINKDLATTLPTPTSIVDEDPNEPRTEECPLDGGMHTKKAKDAWELRRPLAVMIENHTEARPQSGLTSADVVYEAVAEGGITRFMAVFLCNLSDIQIGPIRSARTYFLDWASEYDPLYAHVGGANTPGKANALGQIIDYEIKSLNQFGIGFPTYWRDYQRLGHAVATEHTMYSTTQKLWVAGAKREWTATDSAGIRWDAKFTPWKFKDDSGGGGTSRISVEFWEGKRDFAVEWNYDSTCNCYRRKHSGQESTDLNNKKTISPKNVVIQFQKESRADDGYENNLHLIYGTKGTGKALIFQDGKATEGTWSKANRLARTKFMDKSGKEISFNRDQIWIQTVPEGSSVEY